MGMGGSSNGLNGNPGGSGGVGNGPNGIKQDLDMPYGLSSYQRDQSDRGWNGGGGGGGSNNHQHSNPRNGSSSVSVAFVHAYFEL